MSKPVVEVQVRAVAATSGGYAVSLGNENKVFVMFVDQREHLASARSKDRKGDRQRSQADNLFCETCPQRRERIAAEEDHRDRCAAQRLYRYGDSAPRPDLRKSRCLGRG